MSFVFVVFFLYVLLTLDMSYGHESFEVRELARLQQTNIIESVQRFAYTGERMHSHSRHKAYKPIGFQSVRSSLVRLPHTIGYFHPGAAQTFLTANCTPKRKPDPCFRRTSLTSQSPYTPGPSIRSAAPVAWDLISQVIELFLILSAPLLFARYLYIHTFYLRL